MVCKKNYFGYDCKRFIKGCIEGNYFCDYCDEGYLLLLSRCIKCPKNCLICTIEK